MIVRFRERNSQFMMGLLIQKYDDTYFGYVFDMDIKEPNISTNPIFNNKTIAGLLRDFNRSYFESLTSIITSPVIGDGEFKEELLEALKKI